MIATTDARETLNTIRDQIRSAQQVYVGTFTSSNGTFSRITAGARRSATPCKCSPPPTRVSQYYTIIYMDPSTNEVFSITNNPATSNTLDGLTLLAQYMTNYYCFDAEDYRSWLFTNSNIFLNQNVMTNYNNNPASA